MQRALRVFGKHCGKAGKPRCLLSLNSHCRHSDARPQSERGSHGMSRDTLNCVDARYVNTREHPGVWKTTHKGKRKTGTNTKLAKPWVSLPHFQKGLLWPRGAHRICRQRERGGIHDNIHILLKDKQILKSLGRKRYSLQETLRESNSIVIHQPCNIVCWQCTSDWILSSQAQSSTQFLMPITLAIKE